jgi:hypothetical protein
MSTTPKRRKKSAPARKPLTPERIAANRRAFEEREAKRHDQEAKLILAIKASLPALEALLAEVNGHWKYEDLVYRFYHQSYKVFRAQDATVQIVVALRALLPEAKINDWFETILAQGTGRTFQLEDNPRWLDVTRPILEAFFHAKYMLEMVCKYGRELDEPVNLLPSGWAAVLYLYGLR